MRLKILSYNIHKGFSFTRTNFVLGEMREALRTMKPDLVFLQEVQGHHERHASKIPAWPNGAQFEFLADEMWPHYAYGKNAVYAEGHHGNAILSKFPFGAWENVDVTTNRLERRGIIHGIIPLPKRRHPLHVFCVHLSLLESSRRDQVGRLATRIARQVPKECPLVIAGDFNDWRGRATERLCRETETEEVFLALSGRHARSFPAWRPILTLDRIYTRGVRPRRAELLAGAPWRSLSDHLALYCEAEF